MGGLVGRQHVSYKFGLPYFPPSSLLPSLSLSLLPSLPFLSPSLSLPPPSSYTHRPKQLLLLTCPPSAVFFMLNALPLLSC